MKVFLSVDIEGITGTTVWDETNRTHADYPAFREQMTAEAVAACEGALAAGATEIWIKDAHGSGRNIIPASLPSEARLLRSWSGHPFLMVDGIDESFQAMMLVGYHSRAGSTANPLAHTITGSTLYIKINGRPAAEMMINAYTAALVKVPTVFLSGDAGLCEDAKDLIPGIQTVAVKLGKGGLTNNIHPALAVKMIRQGSEQALRGDVSKCLVKLPEKYQVEIAYKELDKALKSSYFPGVTMKDERTLQFEAREYMDVLRLFAFVL